MSELENCCGTTCDKSALAEEISQLQQRNAELAAQVEQLQEKIFELQCFDVDVIRCLKTMAFEHNHSDIPRYKQLAKECMDKISAGNKATELKAQAGVDGLKHGVRLATGTEVNPDSVVVDLWCEGYANKIKSGEVKL